MWDVFLKVLATAFHVIVLVIAVISIVVWIRSPTRLPLYIHVLAFGAFLLGLLFTIGGQGWFYVILFPGIVYVVFIAKSGGETAQTARETRASQKQTEEHDRFVQPESERFGGECNGGDDENLDMALAPPVFVFEGTDLLLFQSLGDAEIGLEGPDVADGVYESF